MMVLGDKIFLNRNVSLFFYLTVHAKIETVSVFSGCWQYKEIKLKAAQSVFSYKLCASVKHCHEFKRLSALCFGFRGIITTINVVSSKEQVAVFSKK